MDCTQAYLASARLDPIRAFIFYKPNNSSNKPQDVNAPVWNLDDGGDWKQANQFPVFAVPGLEGQKMMTQLSLYSGDVNEIPHGQEIFDLYGPNPKDYIRIWTELEMKNPSNMLALWTFFLIVFGALLLIVTAVSLSMHFVQRRRRKTLKHLVVSGVLDLEASGIKRLTVPASHVKGFPLFTYNAEPDLINSPPTPSSTGNPMSSSVRSSRTGRRHHRDSRSVSSDIRPPASIRSKRSSLAGSVDTAATNFQPRCHICLVTFEHRITVIRESPCGHIFHPECIDEFATQNSSLCPMCSWCMLPMGHCPRITNGMVRAYRGTRKTRGRIIMDDSSIESGETKMKTWGKRIFSSSTTSTAPTDVPMTPMKSKSTCDSAERAASAIPDRTDSCAVSESLSDLTPPDQLDGTPQTASPAKISRPRRKRPRALRLLPTQPEDSELSTALVARRGSPSSFARQRMRQLAAKNPCGDPDQQRPICKLLKPLKTSKQGTNGNTIGRRAVGSVFPVFS